MVGIYDISRHSKKKHHVSHHRRIPIKLLCQYCFCLVACMAAGFLILWFVGPVQVSTANRGGEASAAALSTFADAENDADEEDLHIFHKKKTKKKQQVAAALSTFADAENEDGEEKAKAEEKTNKKKQQATPGGWEQCERVKCVHDGECGLLWNKRTSSSKAAQRCCSDVLFQYMKDAHQVLKDIDPEYMLSSGTMLGAVRDQDVIPWETDADIIVSAAIYNNMKALKDAFASRGYALIEPESSSYRACKARSSNADSNSALKTAPWGRGNWFPYMDIYRMTRKTSASGAAEVQLYSSNANLKDETLKTKWAGPYPANVVFPPSECLVRGYPLPCAARPEFFLKRWYGESWQQPNRDHHKWRKNAVITDTETQFNRGVHYQADNVVEAIKWFQLAAVQGHQRALAALNDMQRDNLISSPAPGTAIKTVLLTSAAVSRYNDRTGKVTGPTRKIAARQGYAVVLLKDKKSLSLKLMNLRVLT